jgi:hypothetical protein
MKPFIALFFAMALGLLAGCAGGPSSGGGSAANGSSGGGSSSGVTVFGTIDAGVSSYKNQSR